MIRISTRYVPQLLVLLVLAAIPVAIHGLGVLRAEDCRDPEAFAATERIPGSQPNPNAPEWVSKGLVQWSVGGARIGADGRHELEYRIVRSYDASDLYTYPLKFLGSSFLNESDQPGFSWRMARGERLPVYVATVQRRNLVRLAAYMFVTGSTPVSSPMWMELRSALRKLLSGTRPSTLLMVSAIASIQRRPEVEEVAVDWLASALSYYREVCLP